MLKKILFYLSLVIAIVFFTYEAGSIIKIRSFFYNEQPSILAQQVSLGSTLINKGRLMSGEILSIEFTALQNNLGTVEFNFDNHDKINNDVLLFRIKEKGSGEWIYQSAYETSKMDVGQFFPFGFPIINDSKGKLYLVEIQSQNGTPNDSVSLSSQKRIFQVKYSFTKEYLTQNLFLVPFFLFYKLINYINYFERSDFVKLYVAFTLPFMFSLVILDQLSRSTKSLKIKFDSFIKWLSFNRYIVLLVVVYGLSHIPSIHYTQYWDAHWYWQLLQSGVSGFQKSLINFDNPIGSFMNNYNFLGHPSMGYISIVSLGQLLIPGNVEIFNFQNVVLAIMAICAFYKIVTFFFPGRKLENALISALFAFNPLFFATSISFNLDFPLLVFEILFIEALLYKRLFWSTVWAIFLIFSKETGILLYLSFTFFYLLFSGVRPKQLFLNKNKLRQIFWLLLPIILFALYFANSGGNIWNHKALSNTGNGFRFTLDNSATFSFGFNISNIKTRLFQIFIMNFAWIKSFFTILILIKVFIVRKNYKFTFTGNNKMFMKIFIFTFLTFLLFNLTYTVMPFSRYVVAGVFFTDFIFYVVINMIYPKDLNKRKLILFSLLAISFIQVFKAIDPSPQILFGTRYWGKNVSSPFFGYNDGIVYNSQFVFLDKLTDKINEHSEGDLLIRDVANEYFFKNIEFAGTTNDISKFRDSGVRKLKYVHIPWFSNKDETLEKISMYYITKGSKVVDYGGYYADIVDLELRQEFWESDIIRK